MAIPPIELAIAHADVKAKAWLANQDEVLRIYRHHARRVVANADDPAVVAAAVAALQAQQPFSAIRIGDGEINLLAYNAYPQTPEINNAVAKASVELMEDKFEVNEKWLKRLASMMRHTVLAADIIGVKGFWPRRKSDFSFELLADEILAGQKLRGNIGQWRSIDHMVSLAAAGVLREKTVASAHFYFGVIKELEILMHTARKVYVVASHADLAEALANQFPTTEVVFVAIGCSEHDKRSHRPDYLFSTMRQLPPSMNGTLSLIASGLWAEWYAMKIKQRGGVAIDIGSGFDLMRGQCTRPIHRRFNLHKDPLFSRLGVSAAARRANANCFE